MPLDPQAKAFIDEMAALNLPPRYAIPLADARRQMLERAARFGGDPIPLPSVEDRAIPGAAGNLPIRIYAPADTPLALVVFFHGGGWVLCDLDTHDNLCRDLARAAGVLVVSVGYRLAPEHRFPAAAEDAYSAVQWAAANAPALGADPAHLIVAGDSAGGNLAAAATLMARDRGGPPIAGQLLLYPVLDHYDPGTPSYVENATGCLLTRADMIWFWDTYLPDPADAHNPHASPLRAADLSGLPPATILTCEYDPLRDEGERYAERLRACDVPVTLRREPGMIHGFLTMPVVFDRARTALADLAADIRALASG